MSLRCHIHVKAPIAQHCGQPIPAAFCKNATMCARSFSDKSANVFLFDARIVAGNSNAIFLDELKTRAAELSNVTLIPLFSEYGNFARVDKMQENLPEPLSTYEYFMCGPKPMVERLIKICAKPKRASLCSEDPFETGVLAPISIWSGRSDSN